MDRVSKALSVCFFVCLFFWVGCFFLCFFTDNPVLTSKITVTIQVLDVNEFSPELAIPYETYVCEGAKVGQVSV